MTTTLPTPVETGLFLPVGSGRSAQLRFDPSTASEGFSLGLSHVLPDLSSAALAGMYVSYVDHVSATDLAGELQWRWQRYGAKRLARNSALVQRSLRGEIDKLNSMRTAELGWDGYHAKKPNVTTIEAAIKFLRVLSKTDVPLPAATISSSGNAALFDNNAYYYLDAEFEPDGQLGWLVQLHGGSEREDCEPFQGDKVPPRLMSLLRFALNDAVL